MPMFDIEDSKNIEIKGNKTSAVTMAKIKNVENLTASNNEAGIKIESNKIDDIIELKPNIMGCGINLIALWRKTKKYLFK